MEQAQEKDAPGAEYCRFGKRNLEKMSWIAPLVNNRIGDALNIEMRHQHLFFIQGDRVLDNIGYSEKGRRFREEEFGNEINSLDDMRSHGYWLYGRPYDPAVMRLALERQKDGYYYSFFSNQCQDWADRLARGAQKIEKQWNQEGRTVSVPSSQEAIRETRETTRMAPTEPASIVMGIFAVLLGIAAVVSPHVSGQAFAWILGLFFVASGVGQAVYAFHGRDWRAIVPILALASVYAAAGAVFLLNSQFALMASAVLLAIVFGVLGASNLALGLFNRPFRNWVGHLISGAVMLLFAVLVIARWPDSGPRVLGNYLGIALLLGGLTTVYFSYQTRRNTL